MSIQTWKWVDLPISDEEIQYTQDELGIKLPKPLIGTLKIGNGGKPSKKRFITQTGNEYIFDSLLNVKQGLDDSIVFVYKEIKNIIPLEYIPFGGDPFGNIFCVSSNFNYPVSIYIHDVDSQENFVLLDDSYENFMNRLM